MKSIFSRLFSLPFLVPASLVALVVPFFLESFFTDRVFMRHLDNSELFSQWHPYITFFCATWRSGELPLWSHNLFSGFPLAAFPHAAAFYPFYLTFLALDFARAFPLVLMIQLMFRILLMYGFLREWRSSRFASWLCAAAFSLSGVSMHTSGFLQMYNVLTWIPGIFWLGLRLARSGGLVNFMGVALFSALGYLTGELEVLLYSWIIFYLFLLLAEKPSLRYFFLPGLALIASVLISSAQFLLTQNYLYHSFRSGHEFMSYQTQWGNLGFLFAWLFPTVSDSGESSFFYLGFLLPAGFIAALGDSNNKKAIKAVLILAAVSMIFVINLWPLSHVFNSIPVIKFSLFRYRILFPVIILSAAVASRGIDVINQALNRRLFILLVWFSIIFIAFQFLWMGINIFSGYGMNFMFVSRILLIASLLPAGIYLNRKIRGPEKYKVKTSFLLLIFFLDIFLFSFIGMPRTSVKVLDPPIKNLYKSNHDVTSRVHIILSRFHWEQDLQEIWKIARLDRGPGVIFARINNGLSRYNEVLNIITGPDSDPFMPKVLRPQTQPLMNFLSVCHIISKGGFTKLYSQQPFERIGQEGEDFQLWKNLQCLDLYGIYTSIFESDDEKTRMLLFDPEGFDPKKTLIISPEDCDPSIAGRNPRPRKPGDVVVVKRSDAQVVLETHIPEPGYLSIAESYYPGWRVWIDGKEERISRANYAFQAVPLIKPGTHRIVLKFLPKEFRIGLWVSLSSILFNALVFMLFLKFRATKKKI